MCNGNETILFLPNLSGNLIIVRVCFGASARSRTLTFIAEHSDKKRCARNRYFSVAPPTHESRPTSRQMIAFTSPTFFTSTSFEYSCHIQMLISIHLHFLNLFSFLVSIGTEWETTHERNKAKKETNQSSTCSVSQEKWEEMFVESRSFSFSWHSVYMQ